MALLTSHDLLIFRTSRCGHVYNVKTLSEKAFGRQARDIFNYLT